MPTKHEKQGYTAVRTDDDDRYSRYEEVTIRNILTTFKTFNPPVIIYLHLFLFQCQISV